MNKYLLPLTAAICLAAGASGAQEIQVRVNGDPIRFEGPGPVEQDGRVLVPLRGVLEEMGAYVDWNQASQTVMASRNNMNIRLPIGSHTAMVNGDRVRLDVPAQVIGGSTMVPLRFVSEALGADVRWDSRLETVFIDMQGGQQVGRAYRTRVDETARDEEFNGGGRAYRSWVPTVTSVTENLSDRWLLAGETLRVRMRATEGGRAYFRVRGVTGEIPMDEVEPGLYTGTFHNDSGHDIEISRSDILAGVTVRDRASRETTASGRF
jgi:hypothetical protein